MLTVRIIESVKNRSQTVITATRRAQIKSIVSRYERDRGRLLDILWAVQAKPGYVSESEGALIARYLKISPADIREVLSFYHFFHEQPAGKHQIFLDTSIISEIAGMPSVRKAFESELGIRVGEVTKDGKFGLFETSCIGMSDQGPAALIDLIPFPKLRASEVPGIIRKLRSGKKAGKIGSPVVSGVRKLGPFFGAQEVFGSGLLKAAKLSPSQIISEIKLSGLRGCGGAGYSTGAKWELCANFQSSNRYVVCNADEGEPGTFKDRELLTSQADLMFEGMSIAARAIGAKEGILYLRAEYAYLQKHLQKVLKRVAQHPSWGKFSIRIQLGAGAYVCGEETALLESLEGRRGEPRIRPPFPVERGYRGCPTVVNNVETFVLASQILAKGAGAFNVLGTEKSKGTRLLSISGDVGRPGIFEVSWGISLGEVLRLCQAKSPEIIQVGGPSGVCVSANDTRRQISFEDLATGGSLMVFSAKRDLFHVLENFMEFFVNESCGNCTPCRAGNIVLLDAIKRLRAGKPHPGDRERIRDWSSIISKTSRCGLGATSPNVLTTSMKAFPNVFEKVFGSITSSQIFPFDEVAATRDYNLAVKKVNRPSVKRAPR